MENSTTFRLRGEVILVKSNSNWQSSFDVKAQGYCGRNVKIIFGTKIYQFR